MRPIKDREFAYVILLEDGSYWVSGTKTVTSSINLSSATYLSSDDANSKASKLRECGRRCDILPILIKVDD